MCVQKKYLVLVRYKVVDDIWSQRVSSFFGLIFPFDRLGPTNTSIFFYLIRRLLAEFENMICMLYTQNIGVRFFLNILSMCRCLGNWFNDCFSALQKWKLNVTKTIVYKFLCEKLLLCD